MAQNKKRNLSHIFCTLCATLLLLFSCETLSKQRPKPTTPQQEPAQTANSPQQEENDVPQITAEDIQEIVEEARHSGAETVADVQAFAANVFNDGSPIVTSDTVFDGQDTILLTFAGDIMAHSQNFSKGRFNEIYKDIQPFVSRSDLTFANIETPVDESKDYSTYPNFNVHGEYIQAVIDAGFNVFSLANNHTNDQGLQGIKATKQYFETQEQITKETERPIYASGVKDSPEAPFTYRLIEVKGWKILFMAVTEILNTPVYKNYINYIDTDEVSRKEFIENLRTLRAENPCDLFVLSIHCAEPEYILTINKHQSNYYHKLLDAGVDVVWANHPHVAKDWEVLTDASNLPSKVIFYSMGNTISGQRRDPSFHFPTMQRDYTGDGYISELRFLRDENGIHIVNVNPVLVTTYITPDWLFVVKRLTDDFIAQLREEGQEEWAHYLEARKRIMQQMKGKILWQ